MFRFANPEALLLLLLLIPLAYFNLRGKRRERSVAYPSLEVMEESGLVAPLWKRHAKLVMRFVVLLLIIVGMARPQTGRSESTIDTEGIDIMLVLDSSSSMQAQDFKPKNRLFVAKEVVKEFISKRKNDRIGLVAFAAQAITQCPLTTDYPVLRGLVDQVDLGMLEDGTAIGVALATACNRLKDSPAKSRVVVLLTDGQNNTGIVDPTTAARLAASLGIKVYTIGVGTTGVVPVPVDDPYFGKRLVPMEVKLDEESLRDIARTTHADYFRATDSEELAKIYDRIDALEKTRIQEKTFARYTDRFFAVILPALILLALEIGLAESAMREIP